MHAPGDYDAGDVSETPLLYVGGYQASARMGAAISICQAFDLELWHQVQILTYDLAQEYSENIPVVFQVRHPLHLITERVMYLTENIKNNPTTHGSIQFNIDEYIATYEEAISNDLFLLTKYDVFVNPIRYQTNPEDTATGDANGDMDYIPNASWDYFGSTYQNIFTHAPTPTTGFKVVQEQHGRVDRCMQMQINPDTTFGFSSYSSSLKTSDYFSREGYPEKLAEVQIALDANPRAVELYNLAYAKSTAQTGI